MFPSLYCVSGKYIGIRPEAKSCLEGAGEVCNLLAIVPLSEEVTETCQRLSGGADMSKYSVWPKHDMHECATLI